MPGTRISATALEGVTFITHHLAASAVAQGPAERRLTPHEICARRSHRRGETLQGASAGWVTWNSVVHGPTNPDANLPKLGIKYDATADRRSWELMKVFLAEVLV